MALVFEREIALGPGAKPNLAHEPNNDLWQYKIIDTRLDNFITQPINGVYDNISFTKKPNLMTVKQVRDLGIKNLPGYGAYGFFTLLHLDNSYVMCPIHNNKITGRTPEVTITDLGDNNFRFNITSDEEYECYRIELIESFFTEEKIVYASNGTAEVILAPELAGELFVQVTGYSDEIAIASAPWEGLLTSTGTAPFVPTSAANTLLLTLTVEGWEDDEQTLPATGVKADNVVFVTPTPEHQSAYTFNGILCTAQGINSLTFTCKTTPSANINVQVVII
jgi:hypothetical protein